MRVPRSRRRHLAFLRWSWLLVLVGCTGDSPFASRPPDGQHRAVLVVDGTASTGLAQVVSYTTGAVDGSCQETFWIEVDGHCVFAFGADAAGFAAIPDDGWTCDDGGVLWTYYGGLVHVAEQTDGFTVQFLPDEACLSVPPLLGEIYCEQDHEARLDLTLDVDVEPIAPECVLVGAPIDPYTCGPASDLELCLDGSG